MAKHTGLIYYWRKVLDYSVRFCLENRNNEKMFKLTHTIWKVLTDFLTHYALVA